MIIYNVTTNVAPDVAESWLHWMRQEHIPEVLQTGLFSHHQILHLLDINEAEGSTFAVQYFAPDIEQYHQYVEQFAPGLRQKTIEKWGDKIISFRSLMEVVE
jgi:penicillin-binding protein-related factor A (putative recombinase)